MKRRIWNTTPLGVLARSFAMHHQMVNFIIKEEKGDTFYMRRVAYTLDVRDDLW